MTGDKMRGIYFIKKGKIKCVKFAPNGKEVIIKLAGKGEPLGYSMAYLDTDRYEYSAVCMEDCQVCFLPYLAAKNEIQINTELLRLIANVQYKDMHTMAQTIVNGSFKNVRERIAYAILSLKQKFGLDTVGFIDIEITRQEIANMSATTIESAIRFMSEFQKDKIIYLKNHKIKIMDSVKLDKIVGNSK